MNQSLDKKEKYKRLRKLCVEGKTVQDQIFKEHGIEVDYDEIEEYLKYLVNLTVANQYVQSFVINVLPRVCCDERTGMFLMIVANNILADSPFLRDRFVKENTQILKYSIQMIVRNHDESFEWGYYLLTKIHCNGLSLLYSCVSIEEFSAVVDFIVSKLEKN